MRGVVFCAVLVVGIQASVGAQSVSLTESEALARLSPESARVRAVRSTADVARADVLAAGRWPNPRVTVDRESVAGTTEYLSMVSQAVPVSGRRALAVQSANAAVSAASARADDGVRRLRADLRAAFAELLAAQTGERELTAVRDRLRDLVAVLGRREAAGDAAGYDRLRAEREQLEVEINVTLASTERRRAQATLAGFLPGIPSSQIVAVQDVRPANTVPRLALPPVDTLLERAEASRGDLLALRREAEAAALAARAARRQRLPEPEVVAGTKSSTAGTGDIGSVFMIHATFPLFDRAKPELAQAAALESQAIVRGESFRQALRGQVEGLRSAVEGHRAAAEQYRNDALRASEAIERIALVSYEAGERGILELLDAVRLGALARMRQAALDLAARQVEIELEFVTGWETPR